MKKMITVHAKRRNVNGMESVTNVGNIMKNQKAGDLFSVKREKVVEQKLMR